MPAARPEDRISEVARLADDLAREVLTDSYAALARRAAGYLAHAAPDRLASGQPRSWACGILYALGRINFLSDPGSGDVHMTLKELCGACGVSEATGAAKGREVLDLLDTGPMDPRWSLPELIDRNPLAWMLTINGMMLDARTLPPEAQDALARAGIIPYGPTVKEPGTVPPDARVMLEPVDGPERFRVVVEEAQPSPARHRAARGEIATLHVQIAGIEPPVWRRLAVPLDLPLDDLHRVLQRTFAWEDYHLYAFETKTERYTRADARSPFGADPDELFAEDHVLADLVKRKGSRFLYLYDFGDSWAHDVKVEAIGPPEAGVTYPVCLDGARAGPPEDCGGPWGYAGLLDALADRTHPDHREMKTWVGRGFDPEHFDVAAVNRKLRRRR